MGRHNTGLNRSGIYKITSEVHPDRIYIGSAVNLRWRKNNHFRSLEKGVHKNPKLQSHFNKYGLDDLTFSVICFCDKKELIPIDGIIRSEQFFIWAFKPWFNISQIAGSCLGVKRSEETCKKVSRAQMGRIPWNKGLKGVMPVPWNKGMKGEYKMPEGAFKECSEKRKGTKRPPFSDEWIKNMSISHKGHKDSEETRQKKIKTLTNRPVSTETREKIRIANTGHKNPPLTEDQHENLSIAIKDAWKRRKEREANNRAA